MATANLASNDQIRNGFHCITRTDIINSGDATMHYIAQMRGLFSAIEKLVDEPNTRPEIDMLAIIGRGIADYAYEDVCKMNARATSAGVVESEVHHA